MTGKDSTVTPLRPRRPCPECGRPSARETFPFCSARCKALDLNRWLKGAYAIPVRDEEEEDEKPSPDRPAD
ncbi:DNA gyrase inhibitor YacG [Mesorhizobium sp. PUT5]|uniref:DNA gyrase inhibitor YacG n=1 Tax=Mesorhizobium sp. PUT5 TaxID=3454629 RepID=UPI003FA45602